MQVNVKELTGVLHLKLVFMIVLVLQSFLAVFLKCHQSFQVVPVQYFKCKFHKCDSFPKFLHACCVPHFQPAPSDSKCVRTPLSSCLF